MPKLQTRAALAFGNRPGPFGRADIEDGAFAGQPIIETWGCAAVITKPRSPYRSKNRSRLATR
jgi:hypothetical protein